MASHTQTLLQCIEAFPTARVTVVGDLILDSYLGCRALGVANEAPVPFLEISSQTHALGGAANAAHNLAKLGVRTILAGTIGKDKEAEVLTHLVEAAGIEFHPVVTDRPTSRKTRIQAGTHYYLRLDEEDVTPLQDTFSKALSEQVAEGLEGSRLLLVSDYDKGVLKGPSVEALESMAETMHLRIVGDIKPHNMKQWRNLHCITPNLDEARGLYSLLCPGVSPPETSQEFAKSLGKILSSNIILKLAEEGMIAATPEGITYAFPALCKTPRNVSGAGDTLVAALAAALSCNAGLQDAALLSNLAASIAVNHEGTYAVTNNELRQAVENFKIDTPH
jgi:rfaE bifunctional protein kinase chain/domain